MAFFKKINPFSKVNTDTGFGEQANRIGGRFVNKDGSFNVQKTGVSLLNNLSIYSWLLELSRLKFFVFLLLFFISENIFFTALYLLAGHGQLQGFISQNFWQKTTEIFFFSTQTFTTVGYGRMNPVGLYGNMIAAFESLTGLLSFAFLTGLLYGRFTRPKAYISFSTHALISPFKEGKALMLRMVPYKKRHYLTDAKIAVNLVIREMEIDKPVYKFFQLKLERSRVDFFNMNWTIVHPIDEESPLLNFTEADLEPSDLELFVQLTGFDPIFSNAVTKRTSYTYKEVIWGAKFNIMYHESEDGNTTILEVDKLDDYERVEVR